MKLTQLRYFQVACQLRNITAAAEQLHISQPAVSAAIRDLEEEFGLALLNRKGRTFSLTQKGVIFLEQVDSLLSHADSFEKSMHGLDDSRRQLRLGIPPMIGSLLLPQIFSGSHASDRQPPCMNITEAGRLELLHQLEKDQIDMAFLPHQEEPDVKYCAFPISQLETVCCVALDHRIADRPHISMQELADEPLVLFKDSFFQTESIMGRFRALNISPHVLLQTEQLSTIRGLVSRNIAVGFLFSHILEAIPNVVGIPLSPPMPVQVSLVWKRGTYLSAEQAEFIAYIRTLSL